MPSSRRSRKSHRSGRTRYGKSRGVLPVPTKGSLKGYHTSLPASKRRSVLDRHVSKKGYATVVHELGLVANYNPRNAPTAHAKMKSDMAYLKKEYR